MRKTVSYKWTWTLSTICSSKFAMICHCCTIYVCKWNERKRRGTKTKIKKNKNSEKFILTPQLFALQRELQIDHQKLFNLNILVGNIRNITDCCWINFIFGRQFTLMCVRVRTRFLFSKMHTAVSIEATFLFIYFILTFSMFLFILLLFWWWITNL